MLKEFKEFAMKGNLVDLAVGFILGGAFATLVSSMVNDIVMPFGGKLMGGVDFANMFVNLAENPTSETSLEAARAAGDPAIAYGLFINNIIAFVIVALVMFFIIKGMNKAMAAKEEEPEEPPRNEVLLEEIRNLLAKQS